MKVYVRIPYTDSQGKHEEGDEVTFESKDRPGVERLIDYGIVSRTAPKGEEPAKASPRQQQG